MFDTKHTFHELCLPFVCGFGMCMDLADPVSSGKYSRIFVFTAPVAELTVMSFTVPWNGYSIVATATVVTSCSCGLLCCGSVCVAMSCGGGFTADGTYDSVWDSVKPVTGNSSYYFQYQGFVWCICMLNFWFSSNDEICADNYYYTRFKLTDICRSVKWELYLYGDMTIKVDRAAWMCCPGESTASVLHPTWQQVTHHLWVVPAF